MAIVQQEFYVPDDMWKRILIGEYKLFGGVVRYATGSKKGQIVKHLDPVDREILEQTQSIVGKTVNFAANHKLGFIIGGAIMITAGAGSYIYFNKKREPILITEFRTALKLYLSEIEKGCLRLETINTLMSKTEELIKDKENTKYVLKLDSENLGILVNLIYDYTIQLAESNEVQLSEAEKKRTEVAILDLRNYLKTQEYIFKTVS